MANRGGFSSRLGFIAAAAGSAVGLGNIWGFPYEVGQGGGAAFVVMYLIFCFILCYPVMVTEIAIGRKTEKNPVGAFNALGFKKWSFVGKLGILSGFLILSFYNVIAGWAFGYIFEMASGNFGIAEQFGEFVKDIFKVGAYGLLFMATTAYVVSKGVSGGIEKAAKFLMPTLIVMILALVVYSLTLPNAVEGLKFYLIPDFSEINAEVVTNALGQAFFSLSLGMGALITYGSYVNKKENIVSAAAFITLADVGIAVIAGMMIFPLIGFMSGGTMEGVGSGPALIFVTLPQIFGTIGGTLGAIAGTVFFVLLCFAALTSTVSLLEVPVAYVVDEKKVKRKRAVWLVAGLIYLIGIPSLLGNGYSDFFSNFITYPGAESATDFLSFIANVANDSFLPLGGCLIVFFAAHVWKKHSLDEELANGSPNYKGSFVQKYLHFAISYLAPTILAFIFIITVLKTYFGVNLF
ncbi:sodium-dependent transporter [uncultured Roseivirga sp.]|uniref:sodium-dependent transporter n=1 Tax=uncultured Roseivirga sp. TaxID=543088 RepID=UPI0025846A64|nr:sodium-dependent transporter [uncultured Roseivirga sp.]MEC7756049.1 sodium-dependent transporter [Bacteroidota bacterium]